VARIFSDGNTMKLSRRKVLLLAACAAALPAAARSASAQAYPTRPVRIVVGFAAGGSTDIGARVIGQWLHERLGQPFVIENRPGAGTNVATESVVRAPPDGYTLLMVGPSSAVNASLYDKLNFVFLRDIAPVASLIRQPQIMLANPSVTAQTVPGLIAYGKANPGKVTMASAGVGSAGHLVGELFKLMAGVDFVHVPYRGAGPALADLLGGQVLISLRRDRRIDRASEEWETARARGHHRGALAGAAGRPDRERICAWLRGRRLARGRRAQKYASRDCRQAQPGDRRGPR
jgi:tripartite-type tricarboxylate transporter receptor subunit TctC